jgi:hypothetical protein
MADVTLTIQSPQAGNGATFKYRYRELPSGSYGGYTSVGTNTFTIIGLTEGASYEVEITFVLADGTVCTPVTKTISVPTTEDCVTAEATIEPNGDNYLLSIEYFYASSPAVPNPCGYIVQYNLVGSTQPPIQYSYNTLPPPPLQYPVTAGTYEVKIFKQDCNGRAILCDELEVDTPTEECTGSVYDIALIYQSGAFYLKITASQSTPLTSSYGVYYQQVSYTGPGTPDAGGQSSYNAGNPTTTILIQVFPATLGVDTIFYRGSIQDRCGVEKFEVSLVIT